LTIEIVRQDIRSPATGQHYIVSGVSAMFSRWEVLVFPADEKGEVTSWTEVAGGRGISHEDAIADLEMALAGDEA
jgi:hypothetical protein